MNKRSGVIQLVSTYSQALPGIASDVESGDISHESKVNLGIKDSSGLIEVSNHQHDSRTRHEFLIDDVSSLVPPGLELSNDQLQASLAITCSLLSGDVFYSTGTSVRLSNLFHQVPPPAEDSEPVEVEGNKTVQWTEIMPIRDELRISIIRAIELSEVDLLDLNKKIVSIEPFAERARNVAQSNIVFCLKTYLEAMESTSPFVCFTKLGAVLEVAVTAAGGYKRGSVLDAEVSRLAAIDPKIAEQLRVCYNRFKHGAQSPAHQSQYEECTRMLAPNLEKLAKATASVLNGIL